MQFNASNFRLLLAAGLIAIALPGCGGSGASEGKGTDTTQVDTVLKVNMDPGAFPVNQIPDAYFGKQLTQAVDPKLKVSNDTLGETAEKLPEWLDALVSRESIVCFSTVAMAQNPDAAEFVQQSAKLYDAGNGWKAFVVNFAVRPAGTIVVYGAYKDEAQSYWASAYRNGPMTMQIAAVAEIPDAAAITGTMTTDKDPNSPFRAELKKETGTLFLPKQ